MLRCCLLPAPPLKLCSALFVCVCVCVVADDGLTAMCWIQHMYVERFVTQLQARSFSPLGARSLPVALVSICLSPPPGFSCRKQDGAGPASVSELVDFLGVLKRFSEDQLERLNGNKANEAGRASGSPAAHDEEVVGDAEEEHGEGGECEEMGGGYDEMESESGDEMEGACDEMEGMERGGGGRCCDAAGETFFGAWSLSVSGLGGRNCSCVCALSPSLSSPFQSIQGRELCVTKTGRSRRRK